MHVDKIVGRLKTSEQQLADALLLVSDRHSQDPEVRDVARTIAAWSVEHVDRLAPIEKKYGIAVTKQPDQLRSALFHDPRIGGLGLLEDLHDLGLLAHQVKLLWTELGQAARQLLDRDLEALCTDASTQTDRQVKWILAQVKVVAPQSLTVSSDKVHEIEASLPRTVSAAALPDALWAPLVPIVLLGVVGAGSLLSGEPWLLPSLGPSAYLVAVDWAHPSARVYNTVVGHVIGLAAGFALVFAFGAYADPSPLAAGTITFGRVAAAALSVALTIAVAIPLKADHPPAGATALLVTLGGIRTTRQAIALVIGASVLGVLGVGFRLIRSGRLRRKEEMTRPRRLEPQLGAT